MRSGAESHPKVGARVRPTDQEGIRSTVMTGSMHDWQADFAVFNERGELTAVAEAKKKSNVDRKWATAWFRNYLVHQRSSVPAFVLLATPDKLYLWKQPSDATSAEPTAVADAQRLFAGYLQRSARGVSELSGRTFELVVGAWLNDLSQHIWLPIAPDEVSALVETGLFDAVENGRVVADVAA